MTIKRFYVLVATLCCAVLLSGCAVNGQGPSFSEAQAKNYVKGKAVVYVYRKYAEPTAWGGTIRFDKEEVATLHQGAFTWAYLGSGKHTIRAVWPVISAQKDSLIELDIEAENTYYIELTGISRSTFAGVVPGVGVMLNIQMGSGLNEINPIAAEAIVSTCCKFQQPRISEY